MGIVVISLPVILFILIVALAFYLLGRARGRSQAARVPHYPAPPFHAALSSTSIPCRVSTPG
ncbi:hypothetical protein I3843_09G167900 [Carya illinoinensis]|uniref:Uncharacterized protein n=1 Tax=Carya illinoinensis TaxID=32201 RepID=A0A8T1PLX1_CARIL|nr:hypothetical protein CIPAW_09G172400 [Carya illinoinensis]KAG6696926.1 hypothetical protein I3842_09G173700 [Carya illinoinensis]KAG7964389.1 hypothetical protein I3843_09G167900 [Carya illinoinensis]